MTEESIPLLAESYTAYGKQSFTRNWVRTMRQSVVINGDNSTVSAICHGLLKALDSHVTWTLSRAFNPGLLSGIILPNEKIAIIGHSGRLSPWTQHTVSHTLIIPENHQAQLDGQDPQVPHSVYRHLFIAKEYLQDLENLWTGVHSLTGRIEALEHDLIRSLSQSAPPFSSSSVETYHAFRSSLTSRGPFSFAHNDGARNIKRTLIASPLGSGVPAMLKRLGQKARQMGYRVLLLHCGLDPSHIDHVYFPDVSWLVSHNIAPHSTVPAPYDNVIDLTDGVGADLKNLSLKIEKFSYLYAQAYNHAWEDFSRVPGSCCLRNYSSDAGFWIQEILSLAPLQSFTHNR
ncbi:MAG: hypothetical protein M1294_14080 [Firmicutes bacterium]|nr:hypothetical protein [Bacillota bacterium]MCL5013108.1 hypothetical protein [Bacillota bacterium]